MATRTVTGFTAFIDESDFVPRQEIIVTGPDDILNDQQYCLEVESLLCSMIFEPMLTDSNAYINIMNFRVKGRDMCGVVSTEDAFYYILAWTEGSTSFTVALNHGAGRVATAVTASQGSKIWRGPTTFNMNTTSNAIHSIDLDAKRDGVADDVVIAGVAIFSGT